jgi:hypothetical protein
MASVYLKRDTLYANFKGASGRRRNVAVAFAPSLGTPQWLLTHRWAPESSRW